MVWTSSKLEKEIDNNDNLYYWAYGWVKENKKSIFSFIRKHKKEIIEIIESSKETV